MSEHALNSLKNVDSVADAQQNLDLFYFTDPSTRMGELLDRTRNLFTEEQLRAHLEHHIAYYKKVLDLKKELGIESWNLEKILGVAGGALYNTAAQYWYHNLFWDNLCATKKEIGPRTKAIIHDTYSGIESLKKSLFSTGVGHFSNGWCCLVGQKKDALKEKSRPGFGCKSFINAEVPLKSNQIPLLVLDLWEHAYYLDFKKDRKTYLETIYASIDWSVVEQRIELWDQPYGAYAPYWAP